jgi:hypothetical protein
MKIALSELVDKIPIYSSNYQASARCITVGTKKVKDDTKDAEGTKDAGDTQDAGNVKDAETNQSQNSEAELEDPILDDADTTQN